MTIETNATYRDGALYPELPLNLPENTPVRVRVVSPADDCGSTTEQIPDVQPKMLYGTKPRKLALKHTVSVGSLPPDFSRADIYSDHD